jgi:hypothetical protein
MADWYYVRGQDRNGPVSNRGLRALFAGPPWIRLVVALGVVIGLFLGSAIAHAEDQQPPNGTQIWANPVTNSRTTIGKVWSVREDKNPDLTECSFLFTSLELEAEVFLANETVSYEVDARKYAEDLKQWLAPNFDISSDWHPVTVLGMPGLQAKGNRVKNGGKVEFTIVVSGKNVWRMMTSFGDSALDPSDERDKLVQALFATVK